METEMLKIVVQTFDKSIETQNKIISLHMEKISTMFTSIDKQLIKQNGHIKEHEDRISLLENIIEQQKITRILDCPYKDKIESMMSDRDEIRTIKKTMWKSLIIAGAIFALISSIVNIYIDFGKL